MKRFLILTLLAGGCAAPGGAPLMTGQYELKNVSVASDGCGLNPGAVAGTVWTIKPLEETLQATAPDGAVRVLSYDGDLLTGYTIAQVPASCSVSEITMDHGQATTPDTFRLDETIAVDGGSCITPCQTEYSFEGVWSGF